MKKVLYIFLAIVCFAVPGVAQETSFQDTLLDQMTGTWVLRGTIDGKETTHDIDAQWVLSHQYLEFHEIAREKDSAGAAAYEAIVFIGWDKGAQEYACLWLDKTSGDGLSNGVVARAKREPGRLAFLFKGTDGSLFHTTFVRDRKDDSWHWFMDEEEQGTLQPFARMTMRRR